MTILAPVSPAFFVFPARVSDVAPAMALKMVLERYDSAPHSSDGSEENVVIST
jgi:hypothetical protein